MDRIRLVLTVVMASLLGVVTMARGADGQRAVVSLEGTWQTTTTLDPADTPPAGGWGNAQLPATTWILPVDGIAWDRPWNGMSDPRRFASALLANLGAPFAPPVQNARSGAIPLASLQLVGESPYFGRGDGMLSCYANATLETAIQCDQAGRYRVQLTGHGTTFQGGYPRVQVLIDGKQVGVVEIASATDKPFVTEPFQLAQGRHTLRLVYGNDEGGNGEDRNLFLKGVEFGQ